MNVEKLIPDQKQKWGNCKCEARLTNLQKFKGGKMEKKELEAIATITGIDVEKVKEVVETYENKSNK